MGRACDQQSGSGSGKGQEQALGMGHRGVPLVGFPAVLALIVLKLLVRAGLPVMVNFDLQWAVSGWKRPESQLFRVDETTLTGPVRANLRPQNAKPEASSIAIWCRPCDMLVP